MAYPSRFTRADTPALVTIPRLPPLCDSSRVGESDLYQASPASKNGDTVSGRYGKLSSPYSGTPKTGMRSSALNTPTRLPRRRENAGQPLASPDACDAAHSSGGMDP